MREPSGRRGRALMPGSSRPPARTGQASGGRMAPTQRPQTPGAQLLNLANLAAAEQNGQVCEQPRARILNAGLLVVISRQERLLERMS